MLQAFDSHGADEHPIPVSRWCKHSTYSPAPDLGLIEASQISISVSTASVRFVFPKETAAWTKVKRQNGAAPSTMS
jgi:hypothetical protein